MTILHSEQTAVGWFSTGYSTGLVLVVRVVPTTAVLDASLFHSTRKLSFVRSVSNVDTTRRCLQQKCGYQVPAAAAAAAAANSACRRRV